MSAGAGDDDLALLGDLDAGEAGRRPGVLDLDIGIDAADPGVFAGVVLDAGRDREHLADRDGLRDHAQRGAVLGGDVVEIVGAAQAAGAGHVLHDNVRIARQMRTDKAADQAV